MANSSIKCKNSMATTALVNLIAKYIYNIDKSKKISKTKFINQDIRAKIKPKNLIAQNRIGAAN